MKTDDLEIVEKKDNGKVIALWTRKATGELSSIRETIEKMDNRKAVARLIRRKPTNVSDEYCWIDANVPDDEHKRLLEEFKREQSYTTYKASSHPMETTYFQAIRKPDLILTVVALILVLPCFLIYVLPSFLAPVLSIIVWAIFPLTVMKSFRYVSLRSAYTDHDLFYFSPHSEGIIIKYPETPRLRKVERWLIERYIMKILYGTKKYTVNRLQGGLKELCPVGATIENTSTISRDKAIAEITKMENASSQDEVVSGINGLEDFKRALESNGMDSVLDTVKSMEEDGSSPSDIEQYIITELAENSKSSGYKKLEHDALESIALVRSLKSELHRGDVSDEPSATTTA
jgi:hypothetical protein